MSTIGVPTIPEPLTEESLGLELCLSFAIDKLTEEQNNTWVDTTIKIAKTSYIGITENITLRGIIVKGAECATTGIGIGKIASKLSLITKNTSYIFGLVGLITGVLWDPIREIQDATEHEYKFRVDYNQLFIFYKALDPVKYIIIEFLKDKTFIEQNAAISVANIISGEGFCLTPLDTKCKHIFNSSEINQWVNSNHPKCPLCVKPINKDKELKFSWGTNFKIIKIISRISQILNYNDSEFLPPSLKNRNIKDLKNEMSDAISYSKKQLELIEHHFEIAVQEKFKNEKSPRPSQNTMNIFDAWKPIF